MLTSSEKFNIENKILSNSYLGKNINNIKKNSYDIKRKLSEEEQLELNLYIVSFKKEVKKYYNHVIYEVEK